MLGTRSFDQSQTSRWRARDLGNDFLKEIEPFIYRRYLDYTTVDELRHMKMRIENELLTADDKESNIKLGYGGIREIEFFTQAMQLVNGGYEPELREPKHVASVGAACAVSSSSPRGTRQAQRRVSLSPAGRTQSSDRPGGARALDSRRQR